MDHPVDSIDVAIRDRNAYVRVHGRGTFKMGPSLKEFGMAAVDRGCTRILVEMADCTGMDSTFMGTLAGLAVQIEKCSGAVILLNATEKNKLLIKMLGLTRLVKFDVDIGAETNMPAMAERLPVQNDKRELTEVMIHAHEVLVDVAPENIVKFKDVLTFLRDDLKSGAVQKSQGTPAS